MGSARSDAGGAVVVADADAPANASGSVVVDVAQRARAAPDLVVVGALTAAWAWVEHSPPRAAGSRPRGSLGGGGGPW